MASEESKGEYIVEFQQHGASVKVSAIDPVTMTEVSIVGPRTAGQEELQRAAVAKLHYVMKKTADGELQGKTPAQPPQKKPGIIV